jgi:hypothetical protein
VTSSKITPDPNILIICQLLLQYLQSKQKNLEDARKQRAKYEQMKKARPFPGQSTSAAEQSGDSEAKDH